MTPRYVLMYDDTCGACAGFAKFVTKLGQGDIAPVGHHTREGRRIRSLLGKGSEGMFWLLEDWKAYGGRSALPHLVTALLGARPSGGGKNTHLPRCASCGILPKSASILTEGREVDVDPRKVSRALRKV